MTSLGTVQKRTTLLTYRQAAERAMNSAAWWRKLAARGGVRVIRLGRSVRLREDDVERILHDGVELARKVAGGAVGPLGNRSRDAS